MILTDIVVHLHPSAGTRLQFNNYNRVFIDIFGSGDATSVEDKTVSPLLKIRRFELTQPPTGLGWATSESYDLPRNVRSLSMVVSFDNNSAKFELSINVLRDISGRTDNRFFIGIPGPGTTLVISSTCIDIPNEIPSNPQKHVGPQGWGFSRSTNVGNLFYRSFSHSRQLVEVDTAISYYEDAVCLKPDDSTNMCHCLNNLGNALLHRVWFSSNVTDLDKAVAYHERAVRLTPDGHTDKPIFLNSLGNSFWGRSGYSGDLIDIERAIDNHEQAVRLTPEDHAHKASRLNGLGNSLLSRFERLGDLKDVDKAIAHHEHVVHLTPDGHHDKPRRLTNLGVSFTRRFGRTGNGIDIQRAISYHEYALRLASETHGDKPGCLNNLGVSFMKLFEYSGNLIDIDKAIFYHEQAVKLSPDAPRDKLYCLNNLGNSFSKRFEHSKRLMDIDNAIVHHEHAVNLALDGYADKHGYLNNLGTSFLMRFEFVHNLTDVNKAVSLYEAAVRLTPDEHAERHVRLGNLGISLLARFRHLKDIRDIDRAGLYLETAVRLTPDGHAAKPGHLDNLGRLFSDQFEQSKDLPYIEKAISHHEQAVHLTPDGHILKPVFLRNLGESFSRCFDHTKDSKDLQQAISSFRACAKSAVGIPFHLLSGALEWARLSSELGDPSASLPGYETAMALLPRAAWLGRSLSTRYEMLASMGNVPSEAAAAAIASGRPDIALEWLEQGRSVVWHQLLNLRTPLDDLSKVNQGLADDLVSTSRALENASMRVTTWEKSEAHATSLEEAVQAHHRLAEKWDRLLEMVRALPEFEDFLLPKRLSALSKAADSGPVITINVHKSRSDALILLPGLDDVVHIPLHSNLYEKAQDLQRSLNIQLRAAGISAQEARAGRLGAPVPANHDFAQILATLWNEVVKPILDGLAFNHLNNSDLPRIWWCLTGPLAFLPIHAAGLYDQSSPGNNLSDFAISSYTPTVTALLEAARETPKQFHGLLGVSQSNTPGLSRLPKADEELELIKQFASGLSIHSLQEESATVDRVMEEIEQASWVHFACHAIQDTFTPLDSAFCLYDGRLMLSDIISKSFPNADFAFLSACETATGDKRLPEEAAHLAAGMLAAGYRSVIATMWSIGDNEAPLVASGVYRRLMSGPTGPDSSMAAAALHHAVKQLRAEVGKNEFILWVPFIHIGR